MYRYEYYFIKTDFRAFSKLSLKPWAYYVSFPPYVAGKTLSSHTRKLRSIYLYLSIHRYIVFVSWSIHLKSPLGCMRWHPFQASAADTRSAPHCWKSRTSGPDRGAAILETSPPEQAVRCRCLPRERPQQLPAPQAAPRPRPPLHSRLSVVISMSSAPRPPFHHPLVLLRFWTLMIMLVLRHEQSL